MHFMKKGIDHIGVSVVFFCHDGKGNFILAKRTKKCRDEHGKWDPGSGGVNFKEPILRALKREVKEEYGADIKKAEFLGFRDVHRNNDGVKTHWITLDFKVLVDKKQAKNNDPRKQEDVRWFTLKNLPSPLHSQLPIFIKKYKESLSL